jgi:hypothetical protein
MTLTALLLRLNDQSGTTEEKSLVKRLMQKVEDLGLGNMNAGQLL